MLEPIRWLWLSVDLQSLMTKITGLSDLFWLKS